MSEYDGYEVTPPPDEPSPPAPVQSSSDLIWPFNVIIDFLNKIAQWLADNITHVQGVLKQGQIDFERNIGRHITGSFNWFFEALHKIITDFQTQVNTKIVSIQKLTDKAIKESQNTIDTNISNFQTDVVKRITDLPANIVKLVEDMIIGKINPLYALQKNFDRAFDQEHGWATFIIGNMPDQIVNELDNRFSGGIRDLNRSLEAKYLNV